LEKVIIVNEDNEIIGTKVRNEITKNDIYRVSALWLENNKGETLIAQRSFKKKNNPGVWGPAVAGTNEEGETFESNIYKEAEEEIGLTGETFDKRDLRRVSLDHNYFGQWFFLKKDISIDQLKIQKSEVEQLKWINIDELMEDYKTNPKNYIASMGLVLEVFYPEKLK
jgi:isopentenyldiphosphate isomerase